MERKIALSDLRRAVDEAYEEYKSIHEGEIDPRVKDVDPKTFGIAVVLADGTVIRKGDADTAVPMGGIAQVPVHIQLLTQNTPEEIVKKSGQCVRCEGKKPVKPHTPVSAHGVRAVSAIEPIGDPDSKWNFIINTTIDMMGGASPVLDDKLYEELRRENAEAGVEDQFAKVGFTLYDDAPASIDTYTRLTAMRASAAQFAMMGATIAADGVNPATQKIVFDGAKAPAAVAMMATKGPHKITRPFMVTVGLPAKSSFGGAIMGVLPGVMGIAVTAPALNGAKVSVKGVKALKYIMNKLQLSVFSSAKVEIVKD